MTTNNNIVQNLSSPHGGTKRGASYFTLTELTYSATATAHSIQNVPSAEAVKNLESLVLNVLDPLREAWGGPIIITSGYRCEELNARVGGAKYSYHRLGMAADIRPGNGKLGGLYDLILQLFMNGLIGLTECYIDSKRGYIHLAFDSSGFNVWPFLKS